MNLLDSHDTPRFLSCASGDKQALKLALLFMFAYPGAPCIYYGDEIGLDGEHDPGCRKSFPWEEEKWDRDLLAYVKEVISLRKQNPALRRGGFKRLWSVNGTYAYSRSMHDITLIVALNASDSPQEVKIAHQGLRHPNVVFGSASDFSVADGQLTFKIPARTGAVLK
jgi:glycosidase